MTLVLGIDSSTQSCKALLVEAETGRVIDEGRASHPAGTQVDPWEWLSALRRATEGLLDRAEAVAVAGQQHGMVALDGSGEPVRPAMLWNDTAAAPQAEKIVAELGGPQDCAHAVGSVMVASFTGAKLRWLREHEPENARRTRAVLLPHDYLTWHLGERRSGYATDHGDASGTGYYSPERRRWLPDLAGGYLGREVDLPHLADPAEVVGRTASGAVIAPGTGDNMAAALGLDLQSGDVCVSLGTSGVASAVVDAAVSDGTGLVAGFCDATGRYLPLACTLNGARVLDFAATLMGVDHAELSRLALAAEPGARGVSLLPYLDGERTPNRPQATGVFKGITTNTRREDMARAVVEGLLCSLRDAVSALERATGVRTRRLLLIGGAARSGAIRAVAPAIFGVPVVVPEPREYVALGAARQAAWALAGGEAPPRWAGGEHRVYEGEFCPEVVERYGEVRDATEGWGA
ncbi:MULTISPECIES: xylulokinase [unclassified Corynebacterium]|uniref:xylulokinase n=1 Tax=unclassified Corynebacterium TaxID=2624378 RepID=UPI0029CA03C9|nr:MULTISPECIES: xylulokinase [unclassified Corynebacterium]WPF65426.1 xylulokinase [Corynebacterium sp. 22KM0430]WPF67922.1 xylulokinase [Corynebacterium sp. 21KM1197]